MTTGPNPWSRASGGMIVTTTAVVEGKPVRDYLGIVTGEVIVGANLFRDMFAAITDIVGGRAGKYEEVRYEGYGPGGSAIIVEALTDNRNRTATNVRTAFSKNGGNMAATGAVSHGFERMGMIEYPAAAGSEDKVLEAAMEAGADDIESSDDGHVIWTGMDGMHEVAKALEASLGEPESVKLAWKPNLTVDVAEGDAQTLMKLIDALEDDDDVQTVWGNYEVSDEVMEKIG